MLGMVSRVRPLLGHGCGCRLCAGCLIVVCGGLIDMRDVDGIFSDEGQCSEGSRK
jgi:hypothetical protein